MGLAKRIIPCLDVTAGRVVKGVNFVGLRDAGDPVEIARRYDEQGADELAFLDITASSDGRDLIVGVVGGGRGAGLHSADGGRRRARGGRRAAAAQRRRGQGQHQHRGGARSRSSSPRRRHATARSASWWRSTRKRVAGPGAARWEVYTHGGRRATGLDALEWGREMERSGAGEILLTSMDRDGTRLGFDLELTRAFSDALVDPRDRERRRRQLSTTWPTAYCRGAPTPCSPRAYFTTASTRCARRRSTWRGGESRCGCEASGVRREA